MRNGTHLSERGDRLSRNAIAPGADGALVVSGASGGASSLYFPARRRVSARSSTRRCETLRYLKTFLVTLFGLLAVLIGFNAIVDPYDLYGVRIEGLNRQKSEAYDHMRLYKAVAVERLRPDAVIIGSSRSHFGLDPEHPGWVTDRVYNLSLFDARIYEMLRYLQHAHAVHPLKQVVVGLDFMSFNGRQRTVGDFEEYRLAGGGTHWLVRRWPDLVASLASIDALRSGIRTLANEGDPCVAAPTNHGMHGGAGFECRIRNTGQREVFMQAEREYLERQYLNYDFAYRDGERTSLDVFRELVAFARREGIDMRLFISPTHARQYELIAISGLWPTWEQWKRELVTILSEDAAAHPTARPFPLWDFSGYNAVTTEAVPALGDRNGRMRWYWEASHYKKETGDLVLDRILGRGDEALSGLPGFGVRVTTANLDQHLERIRDDRARYLRLRSADLRSLGKPPQMEKLIMWETGNLLLIGD